MIKTYSIVVIGAGAAGLVVAIGAAKAGKKVLLIDKGTWGGDCTNFGCIPSKSLIASAKAAHSIREGSAFGIELNDRGFLADPALKRTRQIVNLIREHENPSALAKKGVETLTGAAAFIDPHTISVASPIGKKTQIRAETIIIATGSHPRIPDIPGIQNISYLTNETIFSLDAVPESLGIIGGGPIGSELAQAFCRLGSKVTLIQHSPHLLMKEEIEAQQLIEQRFKMEGIQLKLGAQTQSVEHNGQKIKINLPSESIVVDQLLLSAGRTPSIDHLGLESIGIAAETQGIPVDDYGRTLYPHILAIGDALGRNLFTHVAENQARTILKNLLLPWPFRSKLDRKQPIPRVTYTDPEIAAVGLNESEAMAKYGKNRVAVYKISFNEVDRAITANSTDGYLKVITKKWSSKILGATIVAPRAGEMLMELASSMYFNIPLRKLANVIHPYPIYNLAIRKASDLWLTQTILPSFAKWTKRS